MKIEEIPLGSEVQLSHGKYFTCAKGILCQRPTKVKNGANIATSMSGAFYVDFTNDFHFNLPKNIIVEAFQPKYSTETTFYIDIIES